MRTLPHDSAIIADLIRDGRWRALAGRGNDGGSDFDAVEQRLIPALQVPGEVQRMPLALPGLPCRK